MNNLKMPPLSFYVMEEEHSTIHAETKFPLTKPLPHNSIRKVKKKKNLKRIFFMHLIYVSLCIYMYKNISMYTYVSKYLLYVGLNKLENLNYIHYRIFSCKSQTVETVHEKGKSISEQISPLLNQAKG